MKCLGVDYDGTFRRGEFVTKRNLEAVKKWKEAGHCFGIVSGRSIESLLMEMEKNQIVADFLITNNGGVIASGLGEVATMEFIDYQAVLELIAYIKSVDCISYVLNDGKVRSKTLLKEGVKDEKYGNLDAMMDESELLAKKQVAQIVISLENNDFHVEIADYINEHFKGKATAFPNNRCVDIVPYECSKANGLLKVITQLKINEKDVIVVGDQYNDLSMLERFTGYTFEDSPSAVKAMAKGIIEEVADVIEFSL